MGFFDKLKKINIFASFGSELADDFYDELEESLILADTGMDVTLELVEELRRRVRAEGIKTMENARACMVRIIAEALETGEAGLDLSTQPSVVLFIGVNGVGKTTTIGKIGAQLRGEGKKVLFCAADTFRAAAAEQLAMWAERTGVDIVKHGEGADPGAVVFDGIQAAKSRKADVLLIDTAGRLQNKNNLMSELGKINKIIDRELPDSPKESLLVLDASTGQNAISQAQSFGDIVDLSGIILTKIDGTAKGGIIVGIIDEMHLPVYFVGVGEQVDDLQDFDAASFAAALFDNEAKDAE